MPKFSYVIPVYNAEKYLKKCVDSIINQNIDDLEIILVDDGSTDLSGQIIDEYANKYLYITAVHTKNQGPSNARNVGIKKACGEYVLFCDSDDFLCEGVLKKLINSDIDFSCDVIFLEMQKVYENGKVEPQNNGYVREKIKNKSQMQVLDHLSRLNKFPASSCDKIVKRKLILDNNIFFEEGIRCEDMDWSINLFINAKSYDFFDEMYYNYLIHKENSRSTTKVVESILLVEYLIDKWGNGKTAFDDEVSAFLAYEYSVAVMLFHKLLFGERKTVSKKFKEYSYILKYGRCKNVKLVKMTYKILGLWGCSCIIAVYKRMR